MNGLVASISLARSGSELRVDMKSTEKGVLAVVGRSGAGKTTLLRCIAGLERRADGIVRFRNTTWQDSSRGLFVAPHRRRVAMVFQEPRLFAHRSVRMNLEYARRRALEPDVDLDHIMEVLQLPRLLNKAAHQLSLGEQRRVELARALLRKPELLLLDEPLAGMDLSSRNATIRLLEELRNSWPLPMVYVSHALGEVVRLADEVLALDGGSAVGCGALEDLAMRPELTRAIGEAAGAVIEATLDGHEPEYGMSRLRWHGQTLFVPRQRSARGAKVRLYIHARDVSLSLVSPPQPMSVLNVMCGHVVSVSDTIEDDYTVIVSLDVGGRLLAQITRKSAALLALRPGQQVYALIKAAALRDEVEGRFV